MAKAEEWITEAAAPYLEEGEQVLVALVAQARGHMQTSAGSVGIGQRQESKHEAAGESAGFRIASPMALVLTPRRLIGFDISNMGMGMKGKIKEVLDSAPIAEVDSIEAKKLLLGMRILVKVRGVEFKLEAGPGAKAKPMAEELQRLKGPDRGAAEVTDV